ncbi:hypothetical protein BB558_005499 [Smittium angustum]|uniref:Uncharacterized protein n=1 Tax=Smittium angustum TaxID=133377 RepID=A0A2U1J0C9_SMIAN|nr:hypothetical protein BB558_005499 [Smittium angustum]
MKFYGLVSFFTAIHTLYSLTIGTCIDLSVKVSSRNGATNTQVVLKEDKTVKISQFKNIPNVDQDVQTFEENGYKLTIYHKEKKWKLNIPEHMPRKRNLNLVETQHPVNKKNRVSEYKDNYCFFNYE